MRTASGLDGAFLSLETQETPMHVGSLHMFHAPARYAKDFTTEVRRMIAGRLHLAPIFTRRLVATPLHFANPVWIDVDADLDFHVQRVDLPPPGTIRQLQECVAELHAQVLDRDRPLWMLYVFEGLAGNAKAYYVKVHHALLDGQAGAALAAALFDLSPKPVPTKPHAKKPREQEPGAFGLIANAFRHDAAQYVKLARYLPQIARTLGGIVFGADAKASGARPASLRDNIAFGPRTPLNATITGERSFAALTLPLDDVKALARASGATINDVALALCSGALRRWLTRHGGLPKKPLMAAMPISLRAKGDTEMTTQATLSLVNLATNIADPLKRLEALRASSGATKTVAGKAKSLIPTDFPSIGGPWLLGAIAELYGRSHIASLAPPLANVVISNVPGPPMPLYAAGLRMTDYWPLSIVEHGVGLNITMMSYNGTLGVGFTAARCAVENADEFVADFKSAFAQLQKAVAERAEVAQNPPRRVTRTVPRS
ncbi:MAG: wax ester/triacylglycerol synthase family O-acyltransferase [Rhodoblastus sp.]|nr:wax ester/triacylglycerol synthase family O-acyltransferase [Rhodoblastus sp.]